MGVVGAGVGIEYAQETCRGLEDCMTNTLASIKVTMRGHRWISCNSISMKVCLQTSTTADVDCIVSICYSKRLILRFCICLK